MKRLLIVIGLLVMSVSGIYTQTTSQLPFRVVTVSPNFPNIYPRFNTLQATYNAIKDSASVSTGKYFIVNVTTAYSNITDWTGAYKDSINNRSPYMKLVAFGTAVADSILSVETDEFNLIGGVLSLKNTLAGDGLTFSGHVFSVNTKAPILLVSDSLFFAYSAPLYLTPNTLGLKRFTHSGLQVHPDSLAIRVLTQTPLTVNGDTVKLQYAMPFINSDSGLTVNFNDLQFLYVGDSLSLDLDSGLVTGSTGIAVNTDGLRLVYNSNKKLTLSNNLSGKGLVWEGDSLNTRPLAPLYNYSPQLSALGGDTLTLLYTDQMGVFTIGLVNKLYTRTDSGLVDDAVNPLKVNVDYSTIEFNSSGEVTVNPDIAGDGLIWASNAVKIQPNEFAKLENDTLKIKTSYIISFYGDSLTTNVTGAGIGVLPYDSTGVPILQTGKIKRITYTYQLSSGNDTVITTTNNQSVTIGDKIRAVWVNGTSEIRIQKWSQGTRSWSNAIGLSFTDFANKPYRVIVELYAEAQ